jgi:hypothetical protein
MLPNITASMKLDLASDVASVLTVLLLLFAVNRALRAIAIWRGWNA